MQNEIARQMIDWYVKGIGDGLNLAATMVPSDELRVAREVLPSLMREEADLGEELNIAMVMLEFHSRMATRLAEIQKERDAQESAS